MTTTARHVTKEALTTKEAHSPRRTRLVSVLVSMWTAIKCAIDRFQEHRSDLLGTALAFYTLLSIAPLLIVVLAVLGWLYGDGVAHTQAINAVKDLLGNKAALLADEWLTQTNTFRSEASVVGIVLFLFGVSRVFAQLTSALDAVWDQKVDLSMSFLRTVLDTVKRYAVASLLGLALGILLCASTIGHSLLTSAIKYRLPDAPVTVALVHVLHIAITGAAITFVFATLFTFLPHTRPRFVDSLVGSLPAGALFTLGNVLLAEYFNWVDVGVGYGAAGSIVVVLVWLSYSGQIFMFGAELARIVTERRSRDRSARKTTHA